MALTSRDTAKVPREAPCPPRYSIFSGCRHPPMGDGDGDDIVGHAGTWPVNPLLGDVLILQQWTRCVDPTGDAAEGI